MSIYRTAMTSAPVIRCRNCRDVCEDLPVITADGHLVCSVQCAASDERWERQGKPFFAMFRRLHGLIKERTST